MKQLNLLDFIKEPSLRQEDTAVVLTAVLTAGNENNINPLLMARALLEDTPYDYRLAKITRLKLYNTDFDEYK
ncbi:MAG: hypothetical protein GX851_01810 [Clostridiales bacterium]|jgi:hypothetical protein|nr:hypothetical protein [Clostridiales bacterium]